MGRITAVAGRTLALLSKPGRVDESGRVIRPAWTTENKVSTNVMTSISTLLWVIPSAGKVKNASTRPIKMAFIHPENLAMRMSPTSAAVTCT